MASSRLGLKLAVALWATTALAGPPALAASPRLDAHAIAQARFGNDAPWYENNIPLFESLGLGAGPDPLLTAGASIAAHQRATWARAAASPPSSSTTSAGAAPASTPASTTPHGFLSRRGRWLHDRRYAGDYIDFMYEGGGNDRHFAEAIADATWARYLVDGDQDAATRHLAAMKHIYALWDDRYDFDKKLYWIEPLLDATEYTISSDRRLGGKDGFTGGHAFGPRSTATCTPTPRRSAGWRP